MTETEPTQITDFPLDERIQRFIEVVNANVEKTGPLGGLLLRRMGKFIIEREKLVAVEDRDKFNQDKLNPLLGRLAKEAEEDGSLSDAVEAVGWWGSALFPL